MRLYFALYLKLPDYLAVTSWIRDYRMQGSLVDLLSSSGAGLATRYGTLSNSQYVATLFQNVLGRAADPAGLAYWTAELDSGRQTREQVIVGFSQSAEYVALSSSDVYVTMVYLGMLQRTPDPSGFGFWTGYLDSGNSGVALIDGIIASPEYRARFMP